VEGIESNLRVTCKVEGGLVWRNGVVKGGDKIERCATKLTILVHQRETSNEEYKGTQQPQIVQTAQ